MRSCVSSALSRERLSRSISVHRQKALLEDVKQTLANRSVNPNNNLNNVDPVCRFISMGANFSTLGKGSFKDTTPLGMAADRSWISDDHYADDNTKNSGYRSWTVTPLGVIKVLLEAGADPNIPDSKGRYPLHAVVHSYFFDECSKDVFAKGPKCADKYRMVEPLLEHGANPNIGVPSDSSYPPTLLSIVKWEKARKLLIKYGAE